MASTPGPHTRSRSRQASPVKGALPALDSKASFTYGARGKATLRTQVAQESTEFDAAFQGAAAASRATGSRAPSAHGDNDEDDDARARRSATPSGRNTRTTARIGTQPIMPTLAEDDESASAGSLRRRQVQSAAPAPVTASRPSAATAAQNQHDITEMQRTETVINQGGAYDPRFAPSAAEVTAYTIPRYVPEVLRGAFASLLLLFALIGSLLIGILFVATVVPPAGRAMTPWASSIGMRWNHFWQVPPYDQAPEQLKNEWLTFKHDHYVFKNTGFDRENMTQKRINVNFFHRMQLFEQRLEAVENKLHLHDETLKALNEILPASVVVQKTNNEWQLPDNFWPALQEKLTSSESATPLWEAFLKTNSREVTAMIQEEVVSTLNDGLENKQIVSREVLGEQLEKYYGQLQSHHTNEIRQFEMAALDVLRTETERAAYELKHKNMVAEFVKIQATSLAYMHMVANTQQALHQMNFFAPGLGARVDTRLTSPTQQKTNRTWAQFLFGTVVTPHPPIAALQEWREATDCWCAATSNRIQGKAQISIHLGEKIYPDTLIIEHPPASGTRNIKAAPRQIQVWAEIPTERQADAIQNIVNMRYNLEPGDTICGKDKPSKKHVCIGEGKYDIHATNWVQSFKMFKGAENVGLAVNKIVVRAESNWGGAYTCFYRLRMTGKPLHTVDN